ncbi:MAG: hypothetical protein RLZZ436_4484, partial [Planctomycetota bacterium]
MLAGGLGGDWLVWVRRWLIRRTEGVLVEAVLCRVRRVAGRRWKF